MSQRFNRKSILKYYYCFGNVIMRYITIRGVIMQRFISHALTASVVFNLVFMVLLHEFISGQVAVNHGGLF